MREAHKVDVRDSRGSTRLATRGDDNSNRLGVKAKQSISIRVLAPAKRLKRSFTETTSRHPVRAELEWLCKGLRKKFESKMIIVREDDDLAKEARVLNRIGRWHPRKGISYEAVLRHAGITRDTGAEKLKAVSTPTAKEMGREREERRQDMNERRLSGKLGDKIGNGSNGSTLSAERYKRVAAKASFLAQDRMDIVRRWKGGRVRPFKGELATAGRSGLFLSSAVS